MYIYIYIYIYICVCVCVYVCVCVCARARLYNFLQFATLCSDEFILLYEYYKVHYCCINETLMNISAFKTEQSFSFYLFLHEESAK